MAQVWRYLLTLVVAVFVTSQAFADLRDAPVKHASPAISDYDGSAKFVVARPEPIAAPVRQLSFDPPFILAAAPTPVAVALPGHAWACTTSVGQADGNPRTRCRPREPPTAS